jgi:hypothetical protein
MNKQAFPKFLLMFAFGALGLFGTPKLASAVTAFVPTGGLAVTSFVLGAAAATESAIEETRSKWDRKYLGFGGLLLMGIDPDPATYLSGKSVIQYPDSLLQFQQLTWYGAFSDMSTGDTGPVAGPGAVQGSGFFDDVKVFVPQGRNPAIGVTYSGSGGVLTVDWSATPGIQATGSSVNIFGALFTSISPTDLFFETTPPGSPSANFKQNTAAQSLYGIVVSSTVAQALGYPDEPIGFSITAVPEPTPFAMALAGLACGGYSLFRRRRAR